MTGDALGEKISWWREAVKITLLRRVIHYCTNRRHLWPGPVSADLVRQQALTGDLFTRKTCPACSGKLRLGEIFAKLLAAGRLQGGVQGREIIEARQKGWGLSQGQEDYLRLLYNVLEGELASRTSPSPHPLPSR